MGQRVISLTALICKFVLSSIVYGLILGSLFYYSISFDEPTKGQLIAGAILRGITMPFFWLISYCLSLFSKLHVAPGGYGIFVMVLLGGLVLLPILDLLGFFRVCKKIANGVGGYFKQLAIYSSENIAKIAKIPRYYISAFLLSLGWIGVLYLVPSVISVYLRQNMQIMNITALLVSGVLISWIFRSWIINASTWRAHLLRGAIIPYVAALLYLILAGLISALSPIRSLGESMVITVWGLYATLLSFYVVIPMGIFSQNLLNQVGKKRFG